MSIQSTKQYRVKFSDQLIKPERTAETNKQLNKKSFHSSECDISQQQHQQNDRNYHQNYVNLPQYGIIDRIIDIPILHSKTNSLYQNEDYIVKQATVSSSRNEYNNKIASSTKSRNYRSNSYDILFDNRDSTTRTTTIKSDLAEPDYQTIKLNRINNNKSDFQISGIIPLKKAPTQTPPKQNTIIRIPVQIVNSNVIQAPISSNFIVKETETLERFNNNSSRQNRFDSPRSSIKTQNYEENYVEIPITRVIEKSNKFAVESLAHIENLNNCVSIPVIYELNNNNNKKK
jgi:hypothetical protein